MGDEGSRTVVPGALTGSEIVIRSVALPAVVCGGVYLIWRTIVLWNGTEPVSSLTLFGCELVGWALLVSFCCLAWRRPNPERTATVRSQAIDDDVVVQFLDLTPDGAGFVSLRALEPGRTVDLVAELPQLDESSRATRLRLTVTACRRDPETSTAWRIGGTVVPLGTADRHSLLEYCHVVAARNRLSGSGRLRSAGPCRRPGELGFEELWLAVAGNAQG